MTNQTDGRPLFRISWTYKSRGRKNATVHYDTFMRKDAMSFLKHIQQTNPEAICRILEGEAANV